MRALVFGPGRIGCGLAGQLLRASGHEVVFVGRDAAMVCHLNRVGRYRLRLARRREARELEVGPVRAVSAADRERVCAEVADAGLAVTAVGARNLPAVAPLIAAGLERRRRSPLNVLAFENAPDAGGALARLCGPRLAARHGFSGAIVSRAVTHRLGDPAGSEPLVFVGDPPERLVVAARRLVHPLPPLRGMVAVDDYGAWLRHKLYLYSAGHATTAYLGHLKGYRFVHAAIRDPEIRAAVTAAMTEAQAGLERRYGPEVAGDRQDIEEILERFENAALDDPVGRVARDPRRKLAAEERLVGAARVALEAGVRPTNLALAAAAAFCFRDPEDVSASELEREILEAGRLAAFRHVCGLDPDQDPGRTVVETWDRLVEGAGGGLLSLDRLLWAWRGDHRTKAFT